MTWYSQSDKRWAKEKLGFSNLTIGNYGCTVTSIANWLKFFGIDVTPQAVNDRLRAVNGFANDSFGNKALVIWTKLPKAFPTIKFIWRNYIYDNLKVSWYVYVKRIPVLVECRVKNFRHWVLFIGNRKMVDPLIGGERSTSTWPLTGYTLLEKV
jgi:hypothetical protein